MDTISIGKITKGNNSAKNAGGATVVYLCTSSVMQGYFWDGPELFCEKTSRDRPNLF